MEHIEHSNKLHYDFSIDKLKHWQQEKAWHCTNKYFDFLHDLDLTGQHCYYCHFPDERFLEIHHLDGNHDNWNINNLKPICSLCHRSVHVGWSAVSNLANLTILNHNYDNKNELDIALHNNLQRFFLMLRGQSRSHLKTFFNSDFYHAYSLLPTLLSHNLAQYSSDSNDIQSFSLLEFILAFLRIHDELELDKEQDYKIQNHIYDLLKTKAVNKDKKLREGNQETKLNFNKTLALAFNHNVLRPYDKRCGYTLQERLDYYSTLSQLNPFSVHDNLSNEIIKQFEQLYQKPKDSSEPLMDIEY